MDADPELLVLNPKLEILNLETFPPNVSIKLVEFKMLKFLNIRYGSRLNDIDFLNDLSQLEFLDIHLLESFHSTFEIVQLPKLKFLVINSKSIPSFNSSFKNLQGLELIELEFIEWDRIVNLVNLDYLALTDVFPVLTSRDINTFKTACFQTLKGLTFVYIQMSFYFSSEHQAIYFDIFDMNQNLGDEIISEKIFFEKYLRVSECVREFLLNNTVTEIYFKLRQQCAIDIDLLNLKLEGQSKIVEIEESVYAIVKFNKSKDLKPLDLYKDAIRFQMVHVIYKYYLTKRLKHY
ncbi:unnamed protein product [Brachionus calyciflorus]|uniref:Uncharacterized protein n=1 Tax=Brachionus calyciflorus TaxID=104777 RepID=A0A814CCW5_9BILA|nr:unnamed protein product [Brachionus calyciflorus]